MGDHSEKNRVVSDNVIMALAQELDDAGTFVGRSLGISDPVIRCIQKDHQGNLKEINYQILLKWKRQSGSKATKARLALALKKCHRTDLAERYLKGLSVQKKTVKRKSTTKIDPSKGPKQQKVPAEKATTSAQKSRKKKETAKRGSTAKNNSPKDSEEKLVPAKKATTSAQKSRKKKQTAKRGSTAKSNPPKDSGRKLVPAKKATTPAQKSRKKKESKTRVNSKKQSSKGL